METSPVFWCTIYQGEAPWQGQSIEHKFEPLQGSIQLKEKKTQSKCMFRLGDDDIESPYKNFLDTFDFFV